MSTYAEALSASTSKWSSAYIQYITGRGREDFDAYAFVEDFDDIVFYQHLSPVGLRISYLPCGGKSGVISVYEKLDGDPARGSQLFFVDKDTEIQPFKYGNDVLRTVGYSWESHLCTPAVAGYFARRAFNPTLNEHQTK